MTLSVGNAPDGRLLHMSSDDMFFEYDGEYIDMALDPKIKAVGFDMDGTFMHTKVDYVKLARVVYDEFESLGVPDEILQTDNYKLTMDGGIKWLVEHGKSEYVPGINERIGNRATEIEMEHADIAVPFPGAVEVLDLLKEKGYKVGILTRGGREYATTVLGNAGVLKKFNALVARDDYPEEEAKPNPLAMDHLAAALGVKSGEILYLGDGIVDFMTADASGAQFIGVETGPNTAEMWRKKAGNGVRTIPSVAELADLI